MVADNASARGAPNDFAAHLTTELRDGLRCLVRRWVCTAERVPQADPADAVAAAKMSSGWKRSATSIPPMILSHPNDHDIRSFSSSSALTVSAAARSEERRVGKEGRSRWSPYH